MGKSTISMAMFNSYVKLPEGIGGVVEIRMKYLPAITVAGTWSAGSLLWRGLETQARAFADASGVGGQATPGHEKWESFMGK